MKLFGLALCATLLCGSAGGAFADASLVEADGSILANPVGGNMFSPVVVGASLKVGTRLAPGKNAHATLKYADGCLVPVFADFIVTISEPSPCAYMTDDKAGNNPPAPSTQPKAP